MKMLDGTVRSMLPRWKTSLWETPMMTDLGLPRNFGLAMRAAVAQIQTASVELRKVWECEECEWEKADSVWGAYCDAPSYTDCPMVRR